jgi:hypothetical protein
MPCKTKRDLEIEIERLKLELIQVKTELIQVKNLLEKSEIKRGQVETDLVATQNVLQSQMEAQPQSNLSTTDIENRMRDEEKSGATLTERLVILSALETKQDSQTSQKQVNKLTQMIEDFKFERNSVKKDRLEMVDERPLETIQEVEQVQEVKSRNQDSYNSYTDVCTEELRKENVKLRRLLEECEDPCNLTLAEADLIRVAKRRDLTIPDSKYRIDVRGFWQYYEVQERWGSRDPKDYSEIIRWFRGKNDKHNTPPGAKFWLDMLKMFGHDPQPYDEIPNNHPMKMHVEHMFCQNMMGDDSSLRNGMMNLYALESGFNTTVEFKESNTRAKLAFFGRRTERNHRAYLRWRDTGDNRHLPSMFFLRSVHCTDTELTAPRYMASGLRSSGMTRQPRQLRITDFQHSKSYTIRFTSQKHAEIEEMEAEDQ